MSGYDEILPLPRPVSDRRLPMPMRSRAAQFAPFAALTGYDEAVQEAGRRTACRIELSEDEAEALNRKLCALRSRIGEQPEILVTWFRPDEKKTGGAYCTVCSRAVAWQEYRRMFLLQNGLEIPVDDILEITVGN